MNSAHCWGDSTILLPNIRKPCLSQFGSLRTWCARLALSKLTSGNGYIIKVCWKWSVTVHSSYPTECEFKSTIWELYEFCTYFNLKCLLLSARYLTYVISRKKTSDTFILWIHFYSYDSEHSRYTKQMIIPRMKEPQTFFKLAEMKNSSTFPWVSRLPCEAFPLFLNKFCTRCLRLSLCGFDIFKYFPYKV